ncbi:MAG: thiamine phosphate synthase [Pseudomonadota bacterium]|jgi:thiamine-phosphate pyrophosphorylase
MRGRVGERWKGRKIAFDPTLYLVTDPDLSLGRSEEEVVRRAVEAGVTMVQYRDKDNSSRRMIEKARLLLVICRTAGAALIVNDRVDVAMASGADGVHLGQDDMELADARRIAGDKAIIGISVTTVEEARKAEAAGADYLGANGVFPTGTKTDLGEPLGLGGVSRLASATSLPLVAIGGINADNAGDILAAGADGVAIVSYIVSAENIEERCHTLLKVLKKRS